MRALGYSRRQAREIAARGFKAAEAEPLDDTAELTALIERMKQLFERQP